MAWKGNRPTDFALQVLKDGDDHLRKVAGDMLQGVVMASPVDTGAFRGNHRVSVGGADNGYNESSHDKGGNQSIAKGQAEILKAKIGSTVYIQNNLPYALRLENGYSQQAPTGIYALTFLSVASKYK